MSPSQTKAANAALTSKRPAEAVSHPREFRTEVAGTAAFAKFMRAIQAVADAPGELNVTTLSRTTGFPRPTTHRIVMALVSEDMVMEDRKTGRLFLGPRLISLGFRSWDQLDLRSAARAHIEQLRNEVDETVHLVIPNGQLELVSIDKMVTTRNVRMDSPIGARIAMHSTAVGKAWMAALPPDQLASLLPRLPMSPRTEYTIVDRSSLADEVERTRSRGYAIDLQENELDICCYAGAILGLDGLPVACVSVSLPRYRFEVQPTEKIIRALNVCARAIGRSIGA